MYFNFSLFAKERECISDMCVKVYGLRRDDDLALNQNLELHSTIEFINYNFASLDVVAKLHVREAADLGDLLLLLLLGEHLVA